MSSLHLLLLLVAMWITVVTGEPLRSRLTHLEDSPALGRTGRQFLTEASLGHVLLNAPRGARLIASIPPLAPLNDRLIDNYTLIIENPVDTFRCEGLDYGYYADVDNQCKIFHVCLPLHQLYPDTFGESVTYQFSFVCPKYTIFSQDAMVCAWEMEAIPCELSPELYWLNKNFFRKIIKGSEEVYAHVNEPYP